MRTGPNEEQYTSTGLVVLEGPDGVGKTWLADQISKRVKNYKYFHLGVRDNILRLQSAALRKAVELSKTHLVVIDRLWPSDNIYGEIYRPQKRGLYANARALDRIVRHHCGLYVFCLPSSWKRCVQLLNESPKPQLYTGEEGNIARLYYSLVLGIRGETNDVNQARMILATKQQGRGLWITPFSHYSAQLGRQGGMVNTRTDTYIFNADIARNPEKSVAYVSNYIKNMCWKLEMRQRQQQDWLFHNSFTFADPPRRNPSVLGFFPEARLMLVIDDRPTKGLPIASNTWPAFPYDADTTVLNNLLHEASIDETKTMYVGWPYGREFISRLSNRLPMIIMLRNPRDVDSVVTNYWKGPLAWVQRVEPIRNEESDEKRFLSQFGEALVHIGNLQH